ncbi:MAG: hypothetical protein ACLFWL_12245 [Candidatus Brocadiia bacterium]
MPPIEIGSRRELFVDRSLIEEMEGASLRLHQPQPQEIAIVCERPWEESGPGYATVFKDGDLYRMYYRANPGEEGGDESKRQVTCYAESDDGVHWRRPEVGLIEHNGAKHNNIIWQGTISHNMSPFRDRNPDCPEDQTYKAVGGVKWNSDGLWGLVSPDGIHWQKLGEEPLAIKGNFDSHNLVFWDAESGLYRAYWRDGRGNGEKVPPGRDIRTATSEDFINWTDGKMLDYDPNRTGSAELDNGEDPSGDHHQLYTNNVQPYYRAPHIFMGFPARYSDRGWTPSTEHLPDREQRRELADQGIGGGRPTRLGTALWDTLFMTSRDGEEFHVWPEAFVRPGIQRPGSWFYGQAGCAWGMAETESKYNDAPPELSFYVRDNARVEGNYRLRRHTLRTDGFVSAHAPLTGGTLLTKPLTFEGNRLEINFSTSAGGRMRIELQKPGGKPIARFGLDDCPLIYGDEIDRTVSWESGEDVGKLAGKAVRLKVELKDADLYSFRFRENSSE